MIRPVFKEALTAASWCSCLFKLTETGPAPAFAKFHVRILMHAPFPSPGIAVLDCAPVGEKHLLLSERKQLNGEEWPTLHGMLGRPGEGPG